MAVATPLSLNNIVNEFGLAPLSVQTFNSGSGTVTAPTNASGVRIRLWGGGGGGGGAFGNVGTGGGGGAFVLKELSVTGGSTTINYSVGAKGNGAGDIEDGFDGGNSTVTAFSVTYTAGGGKGGKSDGSSPGEGGIASGGDINENGQTTFTQDGGNAGGIAYGGGFGGVFNLGQTPGGGGAGDEQGGLDGGSGRIILEWLGKALSPYHRSNFIPNHSANVNIPTSSSNLGISQFSGAELNFTATITSADISGTQDPPNSYATRGFKPGFGSINRSQIGLSRSNLNTTTLLEVVETPTFSKIFGYMFGVTAKFSGDVRTSTLGYDFFSGILINGFGGGNPEFSVQTFDGVNTTFEFIDTFVQKFGSNGSSNSIEFIYGGL